MGRPLWPVRRLVALVTLALLSSSAPSVLAAAQDAPDVQWSRTLGGAAGDDFGSVAVCPDGGYVLAGWTGSQGAGNSDGWVVRLDASGRELWHRTLGGAAWDYFWSVAICPDGGYVLAGTTRSDGWGNSDGWVVRLDAVGRELWSRTLGGAEDDELYSVAVCPDGGYALAGRTESLPKNISDGWVVRLDADGHELWNRTMGGPEDDELYSVAVFPDGCIVAAGWTGYNSLGTLDDGLVVKLDALGQVEWVRTLGGEKWDEFTSVMTSLDGGCILAGWKGSQPAGHSDGWVVKLDALGREEWTRTLGGTSDERFYSVAVSLDGGYVLTGYTRSQVENASDGWVVKLDHEGREQWAKTIGGANDRFASGAVCPDGGYILAGLRWSDGIGLADAWVVKLTPTPPATTAAPILVEATAATLAAGLLTALACALGLLTLTRRR